MREYHRGLDASHIGERHGQWIEHGARFYKDSRSHRSVVAKCTGCGGLWVVRVNSFGRNSDSCRPCAIVKHGMHGSPEHTSWAGAIQRCHNPKDKRYADYGGAGVIVCDRWRNSFEDFLSDMGRKPSADHSLDRFPDPDGNYEPSNCRWATRIEQQRNLRTNARFNINNEVRCLSEWCEVYGMNRGTVNSRLIRGWNILRALTEPVNLQ